jgi:hypothetical protein
VTAALQNNNKTPNSDFARADFTQPHDGDVEQRQ